MSTLTEKARQLYADRVINNPRMQDRLLKGWRRLQSGWCWIRSLGSMLVPHDFPYTNLYHASVQKTGSHWIKAIFSDPRVVSRTGLRSYPGHRYEWDEFHKHFPPYHFVPALFISYWQYEEIAKPDRYRTFYVLRDPREVVVSWYYSALNSHRLAGKVPRFREELGKRSLEKGINYAIRLLSYKFAFMRSWAYNAGDPNVLILKFEELTSEPLVRFRILFEHCGIDFGEEELEELLGDYTKEAMREREQERSFLAKRAAGDASHYREEPAGWREVFTGRNYELFREINGNLLEELGYE